MAAKAENGRRDEDALMADDIAREERRREQARRHGEPIGGGGGRVQSTQSAWALFGSHLALARSRTSAKPAVR